MSYNKDDFILMASPTGRDVVFNIPKITFVIQEEDKCRLFFGGGEDDYITVKGTIDDFMEIL